MSENVISINGSGEICNNDDSEIEKIGNDLLKTTDQILLDIRADIPKKNIISPSGDDTRQKPDGRSAAGIGRDAPILSGSYMLRSTGAAFSNIFAYT